MKTFAYLNGIVSDVTYTDNRTPDVKFDSFDVRNLSFTATSNVFPAQYPVNIVEIIRPDLANVKYTLEMPIGIDITVDWGTLPEDLTLTQVGNVYTITGITDVADWNTIKAPTITVDPDFQGSFFYDTTIQYERADGRQFVEWQVGEYVPVTQCDVVFSLSIFETRIKPLEAEITSQFGFRIVSNEAVMIVSIDLECDADRLRVLLSDSSDITYTTNEPIFLSNNSKILEPDDPSYEFTITPSDLSAVDDIRSIEIDLAVINETQAGGINNFYPFNMVGYPYIDLYHYATNQNYFAWGEADATVDIYSSYRYPDPSGASLLYTISSPDTPPAGWTPSNDLGEDRVFGFYLAINSSNVLAVGHPEYPFKDETNAANTDDRGRVYIYQLGSSSATLLHTISPNSGSVRTTSKFGYNLKISDSYVAVEYYDDNSFSQPTLPIEIFRLSDGAFIGNITDPASGTTVSNRMTLVGMTDTRIFLNNRTNSVLQVRDYSDNIVWSYDYLNDTVFQGDLVFFDHNDDYIVAWTGVNNLLVFISTLSGQVLSTYDGLSGEPRAVTLSSDNKMRVLPTFTTEEFYDIDAATSNVDFDNVTKVATINGDRALVNEVLDTIIITPSTGYSSNFQLEYQATRTGSLSSPVYTQNINNT